MTGLVLVLRPSPGLEATVARARALGLEAVAAPLFDARAIGWTPPDPAAFDALMLTSAQAARLGGPGLGGYLHHRVYAVGAATAAAARAAGFAGIRIGEYDAEALIAQAAADGVGALLHLAGREHIAVDHPAVTVDRRIVYAVEPVAALPAAAARALAQGAVALLHSPRAARLFAGLVENRQSVVIAAISPAALAAAGTGWAATIAAASPDDEALLAAARALVRAAGLGQDMAR